MNRYLWISLSVLLIIFVWFISNREMSCHRRISDSKKNNSFGPDGYVRHNVRFSATKQWSGEVWMAGQAAAPWRPIDIYCLLRPAEEVHIPRIPIRVFLTMSLHDNPTTRRDFEVTPTFEKKGGALFAVVHDAFKSNVYIEDKNSPGEQLSEGLHFISVTIRIDDINSLQFDKMQFLCFLGDYSDLGDVHGN